MCIQVIERHAICKCRYYKHALDPCQRCGQRRHVTQVREVLVGYACAMHQFNNSLKTCLESIEIRAPFRPSWGWSFKTTASGDVASAFDSYYKEHIAGKMRKGEDRTVAPVHDRSGHGNSTDTAHLESIELHQHKAQFQPDGYDKISTKQNLTVHSPQLLPRKTINHIASNTLTEHKTCPIDIPLSSHRVLLGTETVASSNDEKVHSLSNHDGNLLSKTYCKPTSSPLDVSDIYEKPRRTSPIELGPYWEELSPIQNEENDLRARAVAQPHKYQRGHIRTNKASDDIRKHITGDKLSENQRPSRLNSKYKECTKGVLDTLREMDEGKADIDKKGDNISKAQISETGQDRSIKTITSLLSDTPLRKSSNPTLENTTVYLTSVEDSLSTAITVPEISNRVLPKSQIPLYQKPLITVGLMEPPIERGKTRVRWTCRCGRNLYDDYEELRPGALEEIRQLLGAVKGNYRQKSADKDEESGTGSGFRRSCKGFLGFATQLYGRKDKSSLPVSELNAQTRRSPSSASMQQPSETLFLLMCINHGRWVPKLWQENACSITSDQQLFRIFRAAHRAGRSSSQHLLSLFNLKSLASIRFVQFEAFKNYLVTITKVPDLPPPTYSAEYRPCYATTNPPVGENLLMHYYHHPHDADDALVWFDRIPKKLNKRVQIDGNTRTELGWGVHFVEGLDWMKLWMLGLVGLLLSALVGVLWAVFVQSIQSGFAISACLMMMMTFTTGVVQAAFVK